jgi:pimeloyl-ACP methyl ester carboxylesterase
MIVARPWLLSAFAALAALGCAGAPRPDASSAPHDRPSGAKATGALGIGDAAPAAPDERPDAATAPPPSSAAASTDAAPASPTASAGAPTEASELRVETLKPRGDRKVLVVPGETRTAIVYLHGRCGDPTAFEAWAPAGRKFGTILSLEGDVKCKGGRTKWAGDVARLDARITAAIAQARAELGLDIAEEPRVVVGYSQGSLRAEALATRFPKRYPRAVLIAGPRAPKDTSLGSTEAVLFLVGDHDVRGPLHEAAEKLESHGKNARYLELKDARHGDYGSSPLPTVTEGFDWLFHTPTALGT